MILPLKYLTNQLERTRGENVGIIFKYDEFGEYRKSEASKKGLEFFFEQTLRLKMPVHA